MIALNKLPEFTAALIGGHSYFAGEFVIANTGVEFKKIESAMSERGFCVVVHPFESGRTSTGNTKGTITPITVTGEIEIGVNPEKNQKVAQKDIIVALQTVAEVLRQYKPTNPNDRYEIAENTFDLITDESGRYAYILRYQKLAIL